MEVAVLRVLIIRAVTDNAHVTVIFKNRFCRLPVLYIQRLTR